MSWGDAFLKCEACGESEEKVGLDQILDYNGKKLCPACTTKAKDAEKAKKKARAAAKAAEKAADKAGDSEEGEEETKTTRKRAATVAPEVISVQPVVNLAVPTAEVQKDVEQLKGALAAFNEQVRGFREDNATLRERVAQQEKALNAAANNGALAEVKATLSAAREELARLQERETVRFDLPLLPEAFKNAIEGWALKLDPAKYREKLPGQSALLNRVTGNFPKARAGGKPDAKRLSFLKNAMELINVWWEEEGKQLAQKRNEKKLSN